MSELSKQPEIVTMKISPENLWKVVVALVTAFAATLAGGFTAGLKYQESQSNITIAEVKGSQMQALAKLEGAQIRTEQLTTQLAQWQAGYKTLQSDLSQQQLNVASLTNQLGRSNNCAFIQEQIVATQRLIERPSSILVHLVGQEVKREEQERIASLQSRLNAYQQQLGTCNK